jgi:2-succinyl-5-enolpyruvyl-6-hydroxy-3-cyclohexene-1-carboxylate synthase
MNAPNRATLWASIFVDELARAGLRAVCIAPGSRSTPLTLAFASHPDIKVYSLLDERGAAFFALGMALAGETPVALLCTSGTATANFYPAIIEANTAHIPLLVLTTDRPHELRDSGANQTIDQVKMYGDHVRWFVDVAPPEANPPATTLRYLRTLACRAMAVAAGPTAGPVHLNFPFRKPLEPTPVPGDVPEQLTQGPTAIALHGRSGNAPFTQITQGRLTPSAAQVNLLVETIQQSPRGLIVCGPRCPAGDFPAAITRLAQLSGYPILADALSGLRFGRHINQADGLILGGYDTFLQPQVIAGWDVPEVILHFGVTPTSQALSNYLASHFPGRRIAINGDNAWHDDTHTISDLMWADPELTCRLAADQLAAANLVPRDESWLASLQQAEVQAWQLFDAARQETYFEGALLADVVDLLPQEAALYLASSLPVRHLEQFARSNSKALRVFANRGASGIDGTISSALGAAAATGLPLVLVSGDVAFYHDLNGLLALRRCGVKATIVLINNDGGGIFHRLPIANFEPPFTELFVTPHGLNFEPAAQMFGAGYTRVTAQADFRRALQDALAADTSQIIEVTTDSVLHETMRREIINRMKKRDA